MMPLPLEALLVYTVVAFCALYSVWLFLPARLKQRAARALMAKFTRLQASRTLQTLAQPPSGCSSGCRTCSSSQAAAPGQPVQEHKVRWTPGRQPPG
jgi:hypothetical protein